MLQLIVEKASKLPISLIIVGVGPTKKQMPNFNWKEVFLSMRILDADKDFDEEDKHLDSRDTGFPHGPHVSEIGPPPIVYSTPSDKEYNELHTTWSGTPASHKRQCADDADVERHRVQHRRR